MKKNLRHPIDRTGLNLCKSVKSVGQKKRMIVKSASSAKSVGLYIMQFRFLDRTGRFPYKFRA